MYLSMYPEVSSEGVLLIPLWFISNTGKEKEKLDFFYTPSRWLTRLFPRTKSRVNQGVSVLTFFDICNH